MNFRKRTLKYLAPITIVFWIIALTGVVKSIQESPVFIIALAIMIIPALFITLASLVKFLGIKAFDLISHGTAVEQFIEIADTDKPSVDVFLPICGEDKKVIKKTWQAVTKLVYPADKIKVYVLDDKAQEEMREMAKTFGFNYITRSNNEFKKAGNLRNAFEQTSGDLILILDYDFRPKPTFLLHTVPYMVQNSRIGIVQTPQAFDYKNKTWLEQGAGNIQEFFYNIVQPARDTFSAAICVGTNAIYRRSALDEIGGNVLIEHSEDVWTGFALTRQGYKIKYLPLDLSFGECPSDVYSYFKQQTRWAQGSSSLIASSFFWRTNISLMQRISYISGFMFYVYSALVLLFPAITFLYSIFGNEYMGDIMTTVLALYIILSSLVTSTLIYKESNINTMIAHCLATWSYTWALFNKFILRKNEAWQPTGAKSKGGKSFGFKVTITSMTAYTVILALMTGYMAVVLENKIFLFYLALSTAIHAISTSYALGELMTMKRLIKK